MPLMTRREILGAIPAPLAATQAPAAWTDELPVRVAHEPRTVALRADDRTVAIAFWARLEGNLRPPPQPRPSLNKDFAVAGFTSPRDAMTWTVRAPATDAYSVAVLYNGANEALRGCSIEIKAVPGGSVLREPLRERWWAPQRPWVARHKLAGTLSLAAGENRITLRLPVVSETQVELGANPPATSHGAQNRDLRVWSIELVRPEAEAAIRRRARELHSDHRWMVEGRYGLFTHFSPLTYPFHGDKMAFTNWEWGVNTFDVGAYADAVEETGARWVIFTTSHGLMYWPGPNCAIERRVKGRTTKRDLIMELANELSRRAIRLALYFHFAATDGPWRRAAGFDDPTPNRLGDTFAELFEEVSRRYGQLIWGFPYIDDGFFRLYQHDPPWERWARAIKAGNRAAVVGFSPNRGPTVTPFSDLQLTDSGTSLPEPLPARMFAEGEPFEGLEPGWFIAIDGWRPRKPFHGQFNEQPRHPPDRYSDYFRRMAAAGIPVTANLIITQDVTRKQPFFNPASLAVMRAVRKAVWG